MGRFLRHGTALLRLPANELGFALRSCLRWSRGEPTTREPGSSLRRQLAQARLEALQRLARGRDVPAGCDGVVRALDIGCGDFHYAAALRRWLSGLGVDSDSGADRLRRVVLRGLELDGFGIYRDGHSRADHARASARAASVAGSEVRFDVGDATRLPLPEHDVVTLFFPFLTAHACLAWGAPLSRLRPRRLLRRAVAAVRPGGWLVVANQTPAEHLALCRHLRELPVARIARARFGSALAPDPERVAGQVGSLWRRRPSG